MKGEGTLLEKARKVPVARGGTYQVDPEIVEAGIAWLKGEIGAAQIAAVWGIKSAGSAQHKLILELRNAARAGKLRVELVP